MMIGFTTLCRQEIDRVLRIWKQTILPPVISAVLYFLIFGTFIGSRIDSVGGVSYIEFIVPGFVMMSIVTASYANVSSSFFGSKFQGNVEELLVAPIPGSLVILWYCIGGIFRGLLVGLLVTIVSLFFIDLSIAHIGVVLVFALLTSMLFSLLGMFNGFFAKSFDDVNIIPTFVITPLVYLGGVFYSLDFLSPFWRGVSVFNPILYMVNGLRYGFIEIAETPVLSAAVILFIAVWVFYYINIRLFQRGYGLRS